jgi:hypothetical protein
VNHPRRDGGTDFASRLDVGTAEHNTSLVVLGQAKCIKPSGSVSPDEVGRLVARLKRGWIGVFVTTGTFTRQAPVEIIDDQYPVVLVHGRALVTHVRRLAAAETDGIDGLLRTSPTPTRRRSCIAAPRRSSAPPEALATAGGAPVTGVAHASGRCAVRRGDHRRPR